MPKTVVTIILRSEYIGAVGETVRNEDKTFLGHGNSLHEASWVAIERLSRWLNQVAPGTAKVLPYTSDLPTIKEQLLTYIKDNPDVRNRDIYAAFSPAQSSIAPAGLWVALAELLESDIIKFREDGDGFKHWTVK